MQKFTTTINFTATVLVLSLLLSGVVSAESNGVKGFISVGPAAIPDYEGSQDYEAAPLIFGRMQWQEYYLEVQGTRARANLLPQRFFSFSDTLSIQAGPTLSYRRERDDVENVRVDSLRDIDATIELGGFVTLQIVNVFREQDALTGRVEVVGDATNTHDGHLITLRGAYGMPLGRRWKLGVGVESTYASEEYMSTYFNVDANNAARSGLAAFAASDGFKDIGLDLFLQYDVTERWGVLTFMRASRLIGDAADSPIVDREGSENQFFGGVAVSYRF